VTPGAFQHARSIVTICDTSAVVTDGSVIPGTQRFTMRVLLINPPNTYHHGDDFAVTFPLGLAYLGAVLERSGHEAIIIDSLAGYDPPTEMTDGLYRCGMTEAELVAATLRLKPDLVGLTCAYTVQYPNTRSLARAIRRATNVPIVIGGAHCSALPGATLADGCFDYVVIGEGELPLLALCAHLEHGVSLAGVKGIAYHDATGSPCETEKEPMKEIDELPLPARHLFDMNQYINSPYSHNGSTLRMPYATAITSRGCPLACSFCSVHTIWGRNNRTRGDQKTVDEIEHLQREYGIREIHFEDDMLIMDRPRMIAICREMIARKLDVTWTTPNGVYVNALNEDLLTAMKDAGCYQLALAVESGSKSVLRLMNKNVRLEYGRALVKTMRRLKMGVYFFFIIGMPGETEADVLKTIQYAKDIRPDEAYFSIATPYPGTPLYEQCRTRGYIPDNYDPTLMRPTQPLIETEHLSRQDIRRLCDYAYQEFDTVKPPPWYEMYADDPNVSRRGGIYTIGVGHKAA
jgi:anaerobic magnesium-protoporphyrin IX monomethyl ester cyclase